MTLVKNIVSLLGLPTLQRGLILCHLKFFALLEHLFLAIKLTHLAYMGITGLNGSWIDDYGGLISLLFLGVQLSPIFMG